MAGEIEEMIKEIAVIHGIAVSRDDPIMILHTINQRLMLDNQKAQEAMLASFKSELEALSQRWSLDAKDKAEKVLTVSLNASKQTMEQLMQTATHQYLAKMNADVDTAITKLKHPLQDTYRLCFLNILAASLTLAGAAIIIGFSLRH